MLDGEEYCHMLLRSLFALTALAGVLQAAPAFSVKVAGTPGKPAMILIPGLACDGAVWDSTVARFGGEYEMHVLTLAGFNGQPPLEAGAPYLDTVREAIARYIGERHLARPVIVGHSLGGFLALALAVEHPELTGPLVIVDSAPFLMGLWSPQATAATAQPMAAMLRKQMLSMTPEQWEKYQRASPSIHSMVTGKEDFDRIAEWSVHSTPASVADAMGELLTTDLRERVGTIHARVLVLAALKDRPPEAVKPYEEQYAKLARARVVSVPTARHFIMYDDPATFFQQIAGFLGAEAGASGAPAKQVK
jgi:pimeloyl-ACP methyl ester carboxylesterase